MKRLQRVWQGFRQGEDIDLYITVAVSVVVAVLNVVSIVPTSWIAPLNLAILALLSVAILGNRHRTETVLEKIAARGGLLLTRLPQDEVSRAIDRSRELIILGQNLGFTMRRHYALFWEKLQRGDTIKVLLVNPDSPACDMVVSQLFEPTTADDQRAVIRQSLRMCDQLGQETVGKLEVRLIDCLLHFGAIAVDPELSRGTIYRWHYPFRSRAGNQPQMILRPADGHWYEFFREEIYALWESATPWQAPQDDEDS